MKRLVSFVFLASLLVAVSVFFSPSAYADTKSDCEESGGSYSEKDGKKSCEYKDGDKTDISKIKGANAPKIRACIASDGIWTGDDCRSKGTSVTDTIQNVINTLLFVTGMAAVIVIVISGLRFVTSNGDSNAVSKAKNSIIYASIGLIVAVSAYAIVNFILEQL